MDNYGFEKIPFSDVLKLARDEIDKCRLAVRIGEDNWRPFNFASILDDGAVKVSWWVSFYPLDGSIAILLLLKSDIMRVMREFIKYQE